MDKFIIEGGKKLEGRVRISGSKNAALPVLVSSLLADGWSTYHNIPDLADIRTIKKLLANHGAQMEGQGETLRINGGNIVSCEAPYDLVRTMRASVLVLGPLVARMGQARVSLPGGCAIGARPVNLHLKALEAMGAAIELKEGYVEAKAKRLQGARIYFDISTVGGTENILMAAALAKGTTRLENAAKEPEVVNLADTLIAMGAKIKGAGTDVITIEGVDSLRPCEVNVIPDRIEAGTFMIAAAITGGDVILEGCNPESPGSPRHEAQGGGHCHQPRRGRPSRPGRPGDQKRRREDPAVPGLPDGSAGPDHGPHGRFPGLERHHGDHLREPLHARGGASAPGRQHRRRWPQRRYQGGKETQGAPPSWRRTCGPRPRLSWPASWRKARRPSPAFTTSTGATRPSRRSSRRWGQA